ncbi:ABC transporter substrate-binding protein [Chondromyces apiculatus]|uniref:Leucine-binding protein domain-containing protein n=1 Tax=Chondromyces apiculatus DSM 436 TaxID=1192034 RepID=A0A017T685_9BACT|nr:hypothetical protein [Chondromyces apiculatus]EYF04071.1 Hypothetical protein CAP_4945 [Chondromyces apiculatus DSM 436]
MPTPGPGAQKAAIAAGLWDGEGDVKLMARPRFQALSAPLFLGLALAAPLASGGCGGSGSDAANTPIAALSASTPAQEALRPLLLRFAGGSRRERGLLENDFKAVRARYPNDPLIRVIDAHLAWIALDAGHLARAEAMAVKLRAGEAGVTRDLAQVLQGVALRRRGRAREAYAVLRPLVGKIIDDYVGRLLNLEVFTAATEAKQWADAIDLADVWLREAGEGDRTNVSKRIDELLARIPAEELARALRKRQADQQEDLPESERLLRAALAERLAIIALEKRDVRLAKELLTTSGPLLGDKGDPIAELAGGATTARVGPATVGLLVSVRTPEARRRGAEMAAGVSFGLGLPRLPTSSPTSTPAARVVSRDDGTPDGEDRTEEALAALVGEGAAVLITGIDRGQATAAAAFARAQEIPVLLLHPPDPGAVTGPFVFVVGEEPATVAAALSAALLKSGARSVALLGDAESVASATKPPGVAVALSCDAPLDERTLRLAGVQGLALNGDAACAERGIQASARLRLTHAFGLEATRAATATTGTTTTTAALLARAGRYPFDTTSTDRDLAAWLQVQTGPPGWWAALGRDAAILAQAGLTGLPERETEDPAEVKTRRRAVTDRIGSVTTPLWTTARSGFGGAKQLPRDLEIDTLPGNPR